MAAAAPAAAPAAAAAPAGTTVTIASENKLGSVPGHLFESAAGKSAGVALVVIQEWWGINSEIKLKAGKFQAKGITALVPDLYRGKTATTDQEASHLMDGLDWQGAVKDLAGAAAYLKAAGYTKVFVTGYCMGGALALATGVLNGANLKGAIVYYGIPQVGLADPNNVKIPVQCHFGTADAYPGFSDNKAATALEETLKKIKAEFEFYHYDGLKHAFTKSDGPNYNAAGAALAFDRTVAFITKFAAK